MATAEENRHADPVVDVTRATEIAPGVIVLPDRGVQLVPNIGVITGEHSVLVVDTGLGPVNGAAVLEYAKKIAAGRKLYVTCTHFHPEHAFGAHAFAGDAVLLLNRAGADDLAQKGPGYLQMFRDLGPQVARHLEGVVLAEPDIVYDHHFDLDLGGRTVRLQAVGQAHSTGDQVVTVVDAGVMFTGDLVEVGQFSIFPWFPPYSVDVSGPLWIAVIRSLVEQAPRIVVPGHGETGGVDRLQVVLSYLENLRDETWRRRDAGVTETETIDEVVALMRKRHPEWVGEEWIEKGVASLFAEGTDAGAVDR